MKSTIKLFFLIIFIASNHTYAADNIVYLDVDKLIHNSHAGKLIDENLKKMHKANLDIFEKNEN